MTDKEKLEKALNTLMLVKYHGDEAYRSVWGGVDMHSFKLGIILALVSSALVDLNSDERSAPE